MDQFCKRDGWFPSESFHGFGGVAQQFVRICRAFESLINFHMLLPVQTDVPESDLQKIANGS